MFDWLSVDNYNKKHPEMYHFIENIPIRFGIMNPLLSVRGEKGERVSRYFQSSRRGYRLVLTRTERVL